MTYFKPFNIVIVGFDGVLSSALTGALDMFSFAGISWQRFMKQELSPRFSVKIASMHCKSFTCSNRLLMHPHSDLKAIEDCDLLLIPTIGDALEKVLLNTQNLIPHIRRLHKLGADLASNCSGAFLLAQAGLLDEQNATTHWGYVDKFRKDYPKVKLLEEQLIVQNDKIFCAAGGSAFYDLCLLLIERYCGRDIASQVAKTQVLSARRQSQNMYTHVKLHKTHQDHLVKQIQDYIEENFNTALSVQLLADKFNLVPRTLNRRFQNSVNMRPISYIQTVRVEQAKKLLENGEVHIKSLANAVGYEDISSFNRLFKKLTNLTPKEYLNTCYKSPSKVNHANFFI